MITALILAAGRSRRMGTQKLLLPVGGRAVIARIVDEVLRSAVEEIVVVLNERAEAIREVLGGRAVRFVTNPLPEGDMLSSVRCGLRVVPAECEAVLVVLGDQPTLTADLIDPLVRAFRAGHHSLVVPVFEKQRGHPLLVSTVHREEVLRCHEQTGLRGLLAAHAAEVLEVEVLTPTILQDLDTPEDYARLLRSGLG